MLSEQYLDSLLSRLSDNLNALQSTYSEFTSTYSLSDQKSLELRSEIRDKYKDIHNLALNIKQSLTLDQSLIKSTKESLIKLGLRLKSLPKASNLETLFKEINLASKHLFKLEQSSLAFIEQRFNELMELIIDKSKLDLLYTKKLESQIFVNGSKNNTNSSEIKQNSYFKEKSCSGCQTVLLESRIILNKMNQLVQKINYQAKTIPFSESGNIHKSYTVQNSPSNAILNENLENQLKKLRLRLRKYEKKERFSLKTESNLNLSMEGMTEISQKIESLESALEEREERIEKLSKLLEDSSKEKIKTFESVAGLKKQLEQKITEQDLQIKKLEDKYLGQINSLNSKIINQPKIEKNNQNLNKEILNLKSAYESLKKAYNDSEFKLKEKSLQLEKNSHISDLLLGKDSEISKLENEVKKSSQQFKELEVEYQRTQDTLKMAETELSEAKQNLNSLFSEYDILKNTKTLKKSFDLSSRVLQTKPFVNSSNHLEEINDYTEQIQELQLIINDLTEELTFYQAKSEEQEEFIKELQSNPQSTPKKQLKRPKSFENLLATNKALKKDNQILVESQTFISDHLTSLKSSHNSEISELQQKLKISEKKVEELTEAVNYQQYLYNKLEKEKKVLPNSRPGSRVLTRQNTSPAVSGVQFKSISALQKLIETQKFDLNIISLIGFELEEDDPNKFLDRIIEIKRDRDSSYMISEKYEDLLNELKEELDENDEYNLLACVVNLKEQLKN